MSRDYLSELLAIYWFAPPVALWRATELRVAGDEDFDQPLLDLGCGDGLVARALFGQEAHIDVGFDPWMAQLRRASHTGVYGHLDCADGQRLPYASGTFATVFSNSVLEHIPDPAPVLGEVGRVLREGGRFIFTVPSDHFRVLLDGYVRREEAGDRHGAEAYADSVDARLAHHHYHSPERWQQLLSACGMVVEKARYYVPDEVVRLWDRMNRRYGIGRTRSAWAILASPRFRGAAHQRLMRRLVTRRLGRVWRRHYLMDVADGQKGGGLLVVARKRGDQ